MLCVFSHMFFLIQYYQKKYTSVMWPLSKVFNQSAFDGKKSHSEWKKNIDTCFVKYLKVLERFTVFSSFQFPIHISTIGLKKHASWHLPDTNRKKNREETELDVSSISYQLFKFKATHFKTFYTTLKTGVNNIHCITQYYA